MQVLEAKNLSKVYGDLKAVDDLSLEIFEGEIYGLLGLNGAGKTTTIRMLLDMIKPSTGTVQLFGRILKSGDDLLNRVGYLVETPSSYPELNVVENLQIYAKYRKLNDAHLVESIIDKMRLNAFTKVKSKNLSLGNKQRLALAKALFHNPKLLILDEPTNGLDPAGIVEFRQMLKSLSDDGVTIFLSSHLLDEVSRVASRIGILHRGVLIREVNSKTLDNELQKTLVVRIDDVKKCSELMASLGYHFSVAANASELISADGVAIANRHQIARHIVHGGIKLYELFIREEDLEKYFLRQIGRMTNHE